MKYGIAHILFVFSFVCIFSISCTNKGSNDTVVVYTENTVVLDSMNIMNYTADELIRKKGKPVSDTIFNIDTIFDRKQKVLFAFYSPNSYENIRELVWKVDLINNVTIWYHLDKNNDIWRAFYFVFWDEGMEF